MGKEFYTRRELTFRDEAEGDLIYESEAGTTLERTDDKTIIKVYVDKYQNWMSAADDLWCEVSLLHDWLFDEFHSGKSDFSQLEAVERDKFLEESRDRFCGNREHDPFLYMYFYSDHNWVMYENDEMYMFMYELPALKEYELAIKHQVDALLFWSLDDVGIVTSFMRGWYERANGYREDDEK